METTKTLYRGIPIDRHDYDLYRFVGDQVEIETHWRKTGCDSDGNHYPPQKPSGHKVQVLDNNSGIAMHIKPETLEKLTDNGWERVLTETPETMKTELERKIEKTERKLESLKSQLKKMELPKRWEDLKIVEGYYISSDAKTYRSTSAALEENRMFFTSREQAEAAIALAQLSQLREVYRQGWKPDWNDDQKKYGIKFFRGDIDEEEIAWTNIFLSFQSPEIRDEFLENFRDLIEKAKPLMS
jgi:hypothetical protein